MSTGNACFTIAPSFSPKNYPGLVAWYDVYDDIFDDNSVQIGLRDLSPNVNNVFIKYLIDNNFTLINTRPLEFASEPTGLTVFLVANNNTNTDPSDIDIDEYQNYLTIFQNQSNKPIQISTRLRKFSGAGLINNIEIHPGNYGYITKVQVLNSNSIINAICFNSNINISFNNNNISSAAVYQNGYLSYYVESNSVLRVNTDINTFNIIIGDDGTDDERTHVPFNASIYEIIIYNRVLSENDISNINKHLGQKYNIELENGGNFTYKEYL